jgi:hypothetical protein
MEQSQPTEAPAVPPTPEKPKTPMKTWMIIAVVAVVAIVLIAAVVLGTGMLNSDDGDDGNDGNEATTWVPKAGDFVEYSIADSQNPMTIRMEIKAVTATTETINVTMTSQYGSYSNEQTVSINKSLGGGYDINDLPADVTMTDHGKQTISTKWGSISTDHYTIVDNSESETITSEIWEKNGIALKVVQDAYGSTMTMTLTDTNVSAITG